MTDNTIIMGDFIADESREPISTLVVQVLPDDLLAEWQRCGETADFLSHYVGHHLPNPEQAVNVLSTVLNELVENAIKFSADKRQRVSLGASYYGDTVSMTATNPATAKQVETLHGLIVQLLEEDPEVLFLKRIEESAILDDDSSGLGLITIKKDFLARVGVRFRDLPPSAASAATPTGVPAENSGSLKEISIQVHLDTEVLTQPDPYS